ncbi:MAG TPA: PadR family transcriptional regulator [Candidatus Limnocylindrales bacterium]|nr:PadR family transcriptional regulator [Candidatus Limnocylindrales bacterium]
MRKQCKSTRLQVFSGKEATLNRVILKTLEWKSPLIAYDVWRQLKTIKGFRSIDSKTVYRRMHALEQEGWIGQKGKRPAKVQGYSALYELTPKGKAALRIDEKSVETFLKTATNEQLAKFIDLF